MDIKELKQNRQQWAENLSFNINHIIKELAIAITNILDINHIIILYANFFHYPFISLDKRHLLIFTNLS
jgi:hypothetical protein